MVFDSDKKTSSTKFLIRDLKQRNHELLRFGSIAEGDPETDWPQSSRNAAEAVARGDAQVELSVAGQEPKHRLPPIRWPGFARRFAPMLKPQRVCASEIMPTCWRSACDPLQRLSRWKFSICGSAHLTPRMSGAGRKSRESRARTWCAIRSDPIDCRKLTPSSDA